MSTISGTITHGITLGQAGYTSPLRITRTGTVSTSAGVAVYASGTYPDPSIINQGSVIATGGFDAIELKDGGSVGNNSRGALIQGYTGIDVSGRPGTVTNSGTIEGTGAYGGGVVFEAGGSVGNSGFIQGSPSVVVYFYGVKFHVGGGVFIGGSAGTVSNSGTIVGTGYGSYAVSAGVWLAAGGSVDNSGSIQGGVNISGFPLYGGGAGTVRNSGTIAGVYFGAGGSVENIGLIEGVYSRNAAIMVSNSGTILGGGIGVLAEAGGSIRNTGLIQGGYGIRTGSAAVFNSGTILGTRGSGGAIVMDGTGLSSVRNTGLIQGQGAGGVYISYFPGGGAGAVTNSGTIEGTGGPAPNASVAQRHNGGILLGAGGSVDNRGLIQGVSGIYVGRAAGTVTNSGTIAGTSLPGIILQAGGTVFDSGTITGGNGTAISFGGGGNMLALENGYNLGGAVAVAGAGNTLELLGAAGAVTVDFDKSGAGFTNFDTVAFGPSSNHKETLEITNNAVLPVKISGFTQLHDIVDLTQIAPKNATATLNASDQLVVNNGSQSVSLQLDTGENYSGVVWLARPDGSGGTDVAVIRPGDPATQANIVSSGSAAATGATTASPPGSQYKGGASMSQLLDANTPFEHLILAHGHGSPFG